MVRAEQERDKAAIASERWELQCQQLKEREARVVEEHSRTLERVDQLWKQKWPVNWDEVRQHRC